MSHLYTQLSTYQRRLLTDRLPSIFICGCFNHFCLLLPPSKFSTSLLLSGYKYEQSWLANTLLMVHPRGGFAVAFDFSPTPSYATHYQSSICGIRTFVYYGVTKVTIPSHCSPCEYNSTLAVCLSAVCRRCLPSGQQQNVLHSQKAPNQLGNSEHFVSLKPPHRRGCSFSKQADNTKWITKLYKVLSSPPAACHCIIRGIIHGIGRLAVLDLFQTSKCK